jgi:hypothetical protein
LIDGGEWAVLGAVVEDALGEDWTYAGEGVELGEGGGVEVYGGVGDGGRCRAGWWRGRWCDVCWLPDDDLFAVDNLASEVERGEIHSAESAASKP